MKIYNVNLQVFYSGPSRPQIISIVFNNKKLCWNIMILRKLTVKLVLAMIGMHSAAGVLASMSCFGSKKQSNASTLDRRQMKIYLNFTNQTTFILFVFLSSSFWNCITQGSHSYCYNAVSDQIYTSASFLASSKLDPPPSSISMEKNLENMGR